MPEIIKSKIYLILLLVITLGSFFWGVFNFPVLADINCVTNYGGGQTCTSTQLQVSKTILNPQSSYKAGDEVDFDLKVTNTGDTNIDNVMLTDSLPSFLTIISGNLSENLGTIIPGQTVERIIKTRVNSNFGTGLICDPNTAKAQSGSLSDTSSVNVCVQGPTTSTTSNTILGASTTNVTPFKTTPSTGPEMIIYPLLSGLGALGFVIKKQFSKGVKS